MKTAIYIEDGTLQLVITPESDYEKMCVKLFENKEASVDIFTGSFYDCRGGWVRQSYYAKQRNWGGLGDHEDRSVILKIKTEKPITEAASE